MQFAFTDEQQLIRSSAEAFFSAPGGRESVRRAMHSELGYDPDSWRALAELGWIGIALPEVYGGTGLGHVELAIVQEQMGRCLHPSPFFATACLAAPAIMLAGSEEQRAQLLPNLVAGAARATLVLGGTNSAPGVAGVSLILERVGDTYRLSGESEYVIYGHASDLYVIAARARCSSGTDGVTLLALPAETAGIAVEKRVMLDSSRPMSRLTFTDVGVSREQILGSPENAGGTLATVLHGAAVMLAAEQTGGAQSALDLTLQYVKERVQFGRSLGSFQAVKHRLADMLVRVEAARSAAYYAACVADERSTELAEAAAIAKAYCSEAFMDCAAEMIQLHGGIGFTWEHDAHLYFKRARATSTLLGSPQYYRETLASLIGLDTPEGKS